MTVESLASTMTLGALLDEVKSRWGGYALLDHHQQGEFHHDIILEVSDAPELPGKFLIVSTNCNGGIKDVACFAERPTPEALWRSRCPESEEFHGELPELLAYARTQHWFNPCELLLPTARSEIRPELRRRQRGGGWEPI